MTRKDNSWFPSLRKQGDMLSYITTEGEDGKERKKGEETKKKTATLSIGLH